MAIKIDLTGQRFGKLVVIERAENKIYGGKHETNWKCCCDCGNTAFATRSGLKSGKRKSCGCYRECLHNKSKTKLFKVWDSMKQRCYTTSNVRYKSYGGRGITVCNQWVTDFKAFYDWAIANGYKEESYPSGKQKWSLDRIDNDKGYFPQNCRWVDAKTQANNRRNNIKLP